MGSCKSWIRRWKSILLRMTRIQFSPNNDSTIQLVEKLEKSGKDHDLWTKKLLLGVSGGLDSMALTNGLKGLGSTGICGPS